VSRVPQANLLTVRVHFGDQEAVLVELHENLLVVRSPAIAVEQETKVDVKVSHNKLSATAPFVCLVSLALPGQ
jgi:hypothetical protein